MKQLAQHLALTKDYKYLLIHLLLISLTAGLPLTLTWDLGPEELTAIRLLPSTNWKQQNLETLSYWTLNQQRLIEHLLCVSLSSRLVIKDRHGPPRGVNKPHPRQ